MLKLAITIRTVDIHYNIDYQLDEYDYEYRKFIKYIDPDLEDIEHCIYEITAIHLRHVKKSYADVKCTVYDVEQNMKPISIYRDAIQV